MNVLWQETTAASETPHGWMVQTLGARLLESCVLAMGEGLGGVVASGTLPDTQGQESPPRPCTDEPGESGAGSPQPFSLRLPPTTRVRVLWHEDEAPRGAGLWGEADGSSATGNILTVFLFWTSSVMQPSYLVFPKAPSVPISTRPRSPIQGPLAPAKPSLAKLSCRETRCCIGSRARIALT